MIKYDGPWHVSMPAEPGYSEYNPDYYPMSSAPNSQFVWSNYISTATFNMFVITNKNCKHRNFASLKG